MTHVIDNLLGNTLTRYEFLYITAIISVGTLIYSYLGWNISHSVTLESFGEFVVWYLSPLLFSFLFFYNLTERMKNLFGILVVTVIFPETQRFLYQDILANYSTYTGIDLLLHPSSCFMLVGLFILVWPDIKSDIEFLCYNGFCCFLQYKQFYFHRMRLFQKELCGWESKLNHDYPELAQWLRQDWHTLSLYRKKDILNTILQNECVNLSTKEPLILQFDNDFTGKERTIVGKLDYRQKVLRINWRVFHHRCTEEVLICFLTLIQSAYFYKMNQITDDEADERKIYAHFAKHRDIASYDLISMFYAKHYASQYLQWAQRVCRKNYKNSQIDSDISR